jgi:SAM-dependent methyltransferase
MDTKAFLAIAFGALVVLLLRRILGGRTLDATWLAFARVPLNEVAFRIRRAIGFRRGPPVHPNEPKDDLFDFVDDPAERDALARRERDLRVRYHLDALAARSTREVYRDNLYVLDLCDRVIDDAKLPRPTARLRAVDVGSKDFRYAFALERFLSVRRPEGAVDLTGIEIDGHPVYADARSRADHAEAFVAEVEQAPIAPERPSRVRYRVVDYLESDDRDVDVVFFFFPFVLRYAIVRWGLPLGHFAPQRLFEHAARSLAPGGLLVVVNHTHEEQIAQRALLDAVPALEVVVSENASTRLVDYFEQTEERTITLARRRADAPTEVV